MHFARDCKSQVCSVWGLACTAQRSRWCTAQSLMPTTNNKWTLFTFLFEFSFSSQFSFAHCLKAFPAFSAAHRVFADIFVLFVAHHGSCPLIAQSLLNCSHGSLPCFLCSVHRCACCHHPRCFWMIA